MKPHSISLLLLCLALMTLGCEGPEGPRGLAGTANVIYSDWYSPETWILQTVFGIHQRSYTMTSSLLTQEIIDHDVVMVYIRFVGFNPEINQLPVVITDVSTAYNFLFRAQAGSIKVVYYLLNTPTTDPIIIPSENQLRYVLIPGGVLDEAAESEGITSEQLATSLSFRPYSEVCRLFGISE